MRSVLLLREPTGSTERLFSVYDDSSRKARSGATTAKGGSGSEQAYSIAYQSLVKEGLVQQIKKKYRHR